MVFNRRCCKALSIGSNLNFSVVSFLVCSVIAALSTSGLPNVHLANFAVVCCYMQTLFWTLMCSYLLQAALLLHTTFTLACVPVMSYSMHQHFNWTCIYKRLLQCRLRSCTKPRCWAIVFLDSRYYCCWKGVIWAFGNIELCHGQLDTATAVNLGFHALVREALSTSSCSGRLCGWGQHQRWQTRARGWSKKLVSWPYILLLCHIR